MYQVIQIYLQCITILNSLFRYNSPFCIHQCMKVTEGLTEEKDICKQNPITGGFKRYYLHETKTNNAMM